MEKKRSRDLKHLIMGLIIIFALGIGLFIVLEEANANEEGDGEMLTPEDEEWIQNDGGMGHDDVFLEWKFKDLDGKDENPMRYYLYLSRLISDITTMADELAMAKYVDVNGNPDEDGDLNENWSRDLESYTGFIAKIDDPYDNIDGEGYSHIIWNYKDNIGTGILDGIWYWGVLAEEKSSPSIQRFRTPLNGSGFSRAFHIDTISPDVVLEECNPAIKGIGHWNESSGKVEPDTYKITLENSDEIPTSENPFSFVINDTVSWGTCSGIDISRTMASFDIDIYISGVGHLDKWDFESRCENGGPEIVPFPENDWEAPTKVTFSWWLKGDIINDTLLWGTVDFYFRFLVYDNNGNAKYPNGIDEGFSWIIHFPIDIDKPKAPLIPSVGFYKGEGGNTEYVWLGDMTYRMSVCGPTRYVAEDDEWYDVTMDTAECGVQFGGIKEGRNYVDWEGGDLIGFMSTPEAYVDSEGPVTYYWIDFIPDVDDIAYVARSVDWAKNTNESERLTGEDEKQFVVDKEGPVAPTWEIEITGEDISVDGTVYVEGIVKEDMPKKKGCGIRSVTVYAEGKDKSGKWSIEEDHSVTAFLYDVFDEDAGDFTELLEGRFKVKLPLWPGVNRIYAIANDLLGNPIQYDDYGGLEHIQTNLDDRREFEMALWDYGMLHPDIVGEPQYVIKISTSIKNQDIEFPGVEDFKINFMELPIGNHWIDVERRYRPTELPKWPHDARVGTLNPVYWHVDTSLVGGFQAVIQIYYYDEAGGPAKNVKNEDLRVIANSDKDGNWVNVSDEPPTKYGTKYKCVFTVDHFTDFAIVTYANPLPYENPPPVAIIKDISHNFALEGQKVSFNGEGTDEGTITRYVWISSIDGDIYNGTETDFSTSKLSNGTHIIYLKVQDNNGSWSEEVSTTLTINGIPKAKIKSLSPLEIFKGEEIKLESESKDDGSIVRYVWHSSIDGEIYNGTESTFTTSNLSVGNHTISLKVRDNNNTWSKEVSKVLIVKPEVEKSNGKGKNENNFLIIVLGIIVGVCAIGIVVGILLKNKSGNKEFTQQIPPTFQQTQILPQYQTQQEQQFPSQYQQTQMQTTPQFQPNIQICPYCNAQVPIEFKFCNICGKQIKI